MDLKLDHGKRIHAITIPLPHKDGFAHVSIHLAFGYRHVELRVDMVNKPEPHIEAGYDSIKGDNVDTGTWIREWALDILERSKQASVAAVHSR